MQTAFFAAGCFWGVQFYFDQVPGVLETETGFMGGHVADPSTELVYTHTTGHAETVRIVFDEMVVGYETLVRQFFRMHDPTQLNRQGPDVGDNYRSAIFYTNSEQQAVAQRIQAEVQAHTKGKIVTQLVSATTFYRAEDYQQKYAERTGRGMCHVPYQKI